MIYFHRKKWCEGSEKAPDRIDPHDRAAGKAAFRARRSRCKIGMRTD
jgi:hypothetical protein